MAAVAVRTRTGPPQPDLDQAAEVLRLLADPTRLAILTMLDGAELSVGEIADQLQRPLPAVSQHLAKLRTGRLVTTRRAGTSVYYSQP
ncbi:MAG: winged helix-turn-helix transcriptional regulator, partial [Propionibacteriaceae bacterium]|nr:winged helix-turn-helix transcriptional regulator [Propionibacteriaceae bacterium]